MKVLYKGRPVEIDGVGGNMDEPMIHNAFFLDGDERELNEEELDDLQDKYADELSMSLADRYADDLYDLINDR